MTNRFKNLDTTQLEKGESPHGEIVTVILNCTFFGTFVSSYQWKCKDYARKTSANAFLMHRGLCRKFSDENRWVPENRVRSVKRIFGDAVQLAYMVNHQVRNQHISFTLELSDCNLLSDDVVNAAYDPSLTGFSISKEKGKTGKKVDPLRVTWLAYGYDFR